MICHFCPAPAKWIVGRRDERAYYACPAHLVVSLESNLDLVRSDDHVTVRRVPVI